MKKIIAISAAVLSLGIAANAASATPLVHTINHKTESHRMVAKPGHHSVKKHKFAKHRLAKRHLKKSESSWWKRYERRSFENSR